MADFLRCRRNTSAVQTDAPAHPRCPYAVLGLDSRAMAGCPGYAPEPVEVGAERTVGSGLSCRHLRSQRAPAREGAWVSACTNPVLGAANGDAPIQLRATAYSIRGAMRRVLET